MKQLIVLLFTILIHVSSFGQEKPREKMKALKIGYITEQLKLSSKEAQQFWPIYNEYDHTMEELKRKERSAIKSVKSSQDQKNISEQEAEKFVENYLDAEEKKLQSRKKLVQELREVISYQKIIKLIKAEMDFKRRLLKQLRHKKRRP